MTSAPISARIIVANGPAMKWEKSTTRIPSSAFGAFDGRGACSGKSASMLSSMVHPLFARQPSGEMPQPASIAPRLLHNRASALIDRTKSLGSAQDTNILEKIPLAFRAFGILHLQNVHIVDGATVRPHDDRTEERIIDRPLLHLANDSLGIVGTRRQCGIQIGKHRGVDPGMKGRWGLIM